MDFKNVKEEPDFTNIAYLCIKNILESFRAEFHCINKKNIFGIIGDFKEQIEYAMERNKADEMPQVKAKIEETMAKIESANTDEDFNAIIDELEYEFEELNREIFNEFAKRQEEDSK